MGNNALSCNVVRNLIVVQRTVMCLLTIVCLWCPFTLYAQFNVREGKTTCDVYVYKFKRGKPDTANKTLVQRDTYNSRGHTLETIYYADDGSIKSKVVNKYDEQGKQLESAEYEGENTLISKVTSIYDVRGSEIERTYFFNEEVDTYIFKYDSAGRKTAEIIYDINGLLRSQTAFQYDESGNLIYEGELSSNGQVNTKTIYTYDSSGNLVERESYSQGEMYRRDTYRYDENGLLMEEVWFRADGLIEDKDVYTYDDKGNVIVKIHSYTNDSLIEIGSIWPSSFIYDEKGNLIEKADYFPQGEIYDMTRYTYNEAGQKTETIEYGIGGIKRLAYSVEPKGDGFLHITIWFNPDGSIASKHLRDDFGFYIESVAYGKRGDPEKKTEYKYY